MLETKPEIDSQTSTNTDTENDLAPIICLSSSNSPITSLSIVTAPVMPDAKINLTEAILSRDEINYKEKILFESSFSTQTTGDVQHVSLAHLKAIGVEIYNRKSEKDSKSTINEFNCFPGSYDVEWLISALNILQIPFAENSIVLIESTDMDLFFSLKTASSQQSSVTLSSILEKNSKIISSEHLEAMYTLLSKEATLKLHDPKKVVELYIKQTQSLTSKAEFNYIDAQIEEFRVIAVPSVLERINSLKLQNSKDIDAKTKQEKQPIFQATTSLLFHHPVKTSGSISETIPIVIPNFTPSKT